ncbi:hypothetical protein GOBAR_AA20263 [Gossypium barbadense]|uniref:Uncharacterized protein n=1 Tax=Gossypium barbadense TaxID=3634 RepID=A0A2P5XAQ1_GOSBA|nr:hypothetical protein GOBAR_AA20263 [Gossypium barbadense]
MGSDKLPRPYDMAVGNPDKLKRACDTTVPINRGRACQKNTRVPLHTWAWEKRMKIDTAVQHGCEKVKGLEVPNWCFDCAELLLSILR